MGENQNQEKLQTPLTQSQHYRRFHSTPQIKPKLNLQCCSLMRSLSELLNSSKNHKPLCSTALSACCQEFPTETGQKRKRRKTAGGSMNREKFLATKGRATSMRQGNRAPRKKRRELKLQTKTPASKRLRLLKREKVLERFFYKTREQASYQEKTPRVLERASLVGG